MKKLTLAALLISAYSSAQAAPNIWREGFDQGFNIYSIEDVKGQTLRVSCNSGAADEIDHSVEFEMRSKAYDNTGRKSPLSFIIDGAALSPSDNTSTQSGASDWSNFTQGIAKAKKIDVFINNKKVTSFTPAKSSRKISKGINSSSCVAKFYKN
jgi:hypothetical protein